MKYKNVLFIILILFLIKCINSISPNSNKEKLRVVIKDEDVLRAKENIKNYKWAQDLEKSIIASANSRVKIFTDDFIKNMISEITPSTTTLCPNCIKKGYILNSRGDWQWSVNNPDKIKCRVCGMEFPNDEYKETIKRVSKWNSTQVITYVDMEEVESINYKHCKSSISGVIRGNKLLYMINNLETVAYAYQLSKNITYANLIKRVFNRLASVFPSYLIYSAFIYNEYADCDPKYVAENIYNLTKDPTKNCRMLKSYEIEENPKELYTGFWTASRLGTNGMDGTYAYFLSMIYDLIKETCTEDEKNNYSKNILEQVAYLGINDDSINNKAVYNFKGVALVGLAINNIKYIKFGLNQFIKSIDEWFLKDGGTSESAAYCIQTIGGLNELGYAFKNYSDPDDYIPPEGEIKYKNFNLMSDTRYYESFQYLIWATYSNYYFPSIADSYNTTKVSDKLIELINYAKSVEKGFLKERMAQTSPIYFSLFFRNQDNNTYDKFIYPDVVFPFLSQGYLRTGEYGEKSLIVLDASNYGSHHHLDSLNLVFWKEGHELLLDLGYLLDHENASETRHTYNHNTVYVNDKDQISNNRNGSFSTFYNTTKIKIMQAGSNAYKECDVYNRTIIQIEHENNNSYFVDIFRVHGGKKRQYVFHGPNNNYKLNSDLQFNTLDEIEVPFIFLLNLYQVGYIEIKDVILTEDNSPNNLLSAFPENYNKKPCPEGYTWCHYVGDGKATIEVNNTFKLTSASSNPNKISVNVGICMGNSDGYRVKKGTLRAKIGQKLKLKYKLRGSALPVLYLMYWDDDTDMNTRRYYKTPDLSKISEEFQEYSFEFILGEEKYKKFIKYGYTNKAWNINWNITDDYIFNVYFPEKKNQKVYFESGFGQRDYKNSDYGSKLPYFYIDGSSDFNNYSTFVAVYEAHNRSIKNTVNSVEIDDKLNGNIGIKISTIDGDDYILSATENNTISAFNLETDATVYVKITDKEKNKYACIGGTYCDKIKNDVRELNGFTKLFNNDENNSYFEIETKLNKENINGQSLQIIGNDSIVRTYPIFHVENINNGLKIYTRYNSRGFRVYENVNYRIQNVKMFEEKIEEEKTDEKEKEEENPKTEEKRKLSGFVIFLIVFGCVLFVAGIVFVIYRFYKRKGGTYLSDKWFNKLV